LIVATAVQLLLTHCPDVVSAESIARAVVSEHLAACVNIVPGVRSVYRWQGSVHVDAETGLTIKTTADRMPALMARVRELHPHELPELIVVDIGSGLPEYLDWVVASTRQ